MLKLLVIFITIMALAFGLKAQTDNIISGTDLLGDLQSQTDSTAQLLPNQMLFTQRMLWGKRGMMRHFGRFELTPDNRQRELKLRRTMLVTHQTLGFLTLTGMVAQGVVGAKLYKNHTDQIHELHEGLAAGVNIGYFTTAALALFAPPKMMNERKGYSSIKVHKYLAMLHMSAMIATNILADKLVASPQLRPYHRAAAFAAFGSFAAAMFIIKF